MKQKVIKIGSSAGITMSRETLEELGVEIGDFVETSASKQIFMVKPEQDKSKKSIDPEILQWTDEFISKNRELLDRLKNK